METTDHTKKEEKEVEGAVRVDVEPCVYVWPLHSWSLSGPASRRCDYSSYERNGVLLMF
jgi:hypothetical protein